jgi:hypothetical protein
LFRNDLTAEGAEGAEEEKREMNNSDPNGFDITIINVIPISQKNTPKKPCIFLLWSRDATRILVKTPGFGENLVLSSLLKSTA